MNSTIYKRMVGILTYLTATRPDLIYDVSLVCRFMESPKESYWKFGKIIVRYVAGIVGYGLWYSHSLDSTLTWYIDNDFLGNIDDRKMKYSYVFHLGTNIISRASTKLHVVAISPLILSKSPTLENPNHRVEFNNDNGKQEHQ